MGRVLAPVQSTAAFCRSCFFTMYYLVCLVAFLSGVKAVERSLGSCQFTRDCDAHVRCQNIADAGCVCNFGQCIITGNPFFRGTECERYTDKDCEDTIATCKGNKCACLNKKKIKRNKLSGRKPASDAVVFQ